MDEHSQPGRYQVGFAMPGSVRIIGRIMAGPDGQRWNEIDEAREHLGIRLDAPLGDMFILDHGCIVEPLTADGRCELAAHDAFDERMQSVRARRQNDRHQAAAEVAQLNAIFARS